MSERSFFVRFIHGSLRWLDRLRRTLHFVIVVTIFLILVAILSPQPVIVPASTALVLNPQGAVVEQLSVDPLERAIARAQGIEMAESLLGDMIDAIRAARDDRRVKALVLRLEGMTTAGLSKLQELAAEIDAFRESGKPVYAVAGYFDRNQYFLAAHADEVLMHPMGIVLVEGYETYLPYFRSALEKLEIDYRVWSAGEFKSAVEPITRDNMSEEDRLARSAYLSAMWDQYGAAVAAARSLDADAMQRYADEFATLLDAADGDAARLAVDYGLVDELLAFDQIESRIRGVVGGDSNESGYETIDYASYVTAVRAEDFSVPSGDKVAVIVASGEILDGEQPLGTVGSESMIRLIRAARDDEDVRALVVRVDSPGGSAFASELIRRELELVRDSGRPVVVSMGSVAASGGYWIAMSADEIWASSSTLTGSIGAFATVPTFPRALERLGINIDGVGTTRLSGQMNPLRGIGEDIDAYISLSLRHTYEDFVGKVAQYRNLDPAAVEASAQGRVWIGGDALERGLVDQLGGIDEAIESAADLAGIEDDNFSIEYLEPERGLAERIALEFVRVASPLIGQLGWPVAVPGPLREILAALDDPRLAGFALNDPRGIHAHCLCDVR